jgi:hypothetical protein
MPFAITDTWQSDVALDKEVPAIKRPLPIGTC